MNTIEMARKWTEFLASRPEIHDARRILKQFYAGAITRICDCGCNSYDIKVLHDNGIAPLLKPSSIRYGGCALSMAFNFVDRDGSLEINLFLDADGYLAGLDVSCNANSERVPNELQLLDRPYHIDGYLLASDDCE